MEKNSIIYGSFTSPSVNCGGDDDYGGGDDETT
jgi:hypothetical protein